MSRLSLIPTLVRIAEEAGQILLKQREEKSWQKRLKSDLSPVTTADEESSALMVDKLKSNFHIDVISEEATKRSELLNEKRVFLIDPLDGTKEYIEGLDEFCVNIALLEDGRPLLGLIYAPALQQLYYAAEGEGAFHGDQKIQVRRNRQLILAKSRFHDTPAVEEFRQANGISQVVLAGASLKFAKLALGEATVYPRFNGSKEWDIAAGHVILKEAGGSIKEIQSKKEPQYLKPDPENPYFIACAAGIDFGKLIVKTTVHSPVFV